MKTLIAIILIAASFNVAHAYFWIKGTKLMDSKNNEFLIRGINSANADNDYHNAPSTYYDAIERTGANAIRIQWLIDDEMKGKALSDNNLKVAIQTAIDKKMIPILELWTYTGDQPQRDKKTHPENLKAAGDWWVRKIKSVLKPFEDKLLINIANEWSTWDYGRPNMGGKENLWADTYGAKDGPIMKIRDAGWQGTLIVDSAAYAQSSWTLLKYAKKLIDIDPKKNLLFSLHLYADWKEPATYNNEQSPYDKNQLDAIVKAGIPLLIGEFADEHPDGSCQKVKINAKAVMAKARSLGIGYLGWSWLGNEGKGKNCMDLGFLNIATKWDCKDDSCLTTWGRLLVTDPNGIRATSKKCSVFA